MKVNNAIVKTGQASLQAAIEASGMALGNITMLEITAGTFNEADWNYLKDNRASMKSLKEFTIGNSIFGG